jgi:hypothetical protein
VGAFTTFSYLTCKKVKMHPGFGLHMGDFFIYIMEKESQNPTHIIGCLSLSWFEDDGHLLTFMYGCCYGEI